MRFDFTTVNDFDGGGAYMPPAETLPNATVANFTFPSFGASDDISYVAHFSNGTRQAVEISLCGIRLSNSADGRPKSI